VTGLELTGERGSDYGVRQRADVVGLLAPPLGAVLDVGCAEGANADVLRAAGATRIVGIEADERFAEAARARLDEVVTGSVEDALPWDAGSFDTILCYDVLEHLHDPWTVLARLRELLRPGGRVHVALPNARHTSVWVPLVLRGRFAYAAEGVLDVTHLRFFARRDAEELVRSAGFDVTAVEHQRPDTRHGRLALRVAPRLWPELRAIHWYLEGRPSRVRNQSR
jgi:2-polyprenyl-3-methyl-5-hydroxy-6-metoxy-1,4-benzoquinol methylase